MHAPQSGRSSTGEERIENSRIARLSQRIEHASHLLPAQGPITVFIHHNTLHAFEDLPFTAAVETAAAVYGFQPYLSEDRYRHALTQGRIRFSTLHEVLKHSLGERADEWIPPFGTRLDLRLAMLQYPLRTGPTEELVWHVAEANALRRARVEVSSAGRRRMIAETRRWVIRDLRVGLQAGPHGKPNGASRRTISEGLAELFDRFGGGSGIESWSDENWERFTVQALWRVCCDGVRSLPTFMPRPSQAVRHRDLMLEATAVDTDALVQELLIRFCAAFLDQGLAHWQLPGRDAGFYRSFIELYRRPFGPPERWMEGLAKELNRLEEQGIGPLDSILESLDLLGVAEAEWEGFLSATLLALQGWGGMVKQIEIRGDRVVHPIPSGSLIEFLAVRLVLDRLALAYTARTSLGIRAPMSSFWRLARGLTDVGWPPSVEQRAFTIFQLAQVFGISPEVLYRLDPAEWSNLVKEIEVFTDVDRRRILHLAYEQRFYVQTLDAIALHAPNPAPTPSRPKLQAIFCIDDREESIRRHLEEVEPATVTYGTAGFFSLAIYYRGVEDAHFVPLCPAVIRPVHWIVERVVEEHAGTHRYRIKTRRALGMASHRFHVGSRSFAVGALLTGVVGVLASIPLVTRTMFPRFAARLRSTFGDFVGSTPPTRLQFERTDPTPGPHDGGIGLSLDEMVDTSESVLREIGLTSGFARFVLVIGHGSTSLNNPHESAYDCGACGGAQGGPNARLLAQILNDGRVRRQLRERGLDIPSETIFVGGMHNTSNEAVTFYDQDLVPESHRREFDELKATIEVACDRDAHERSRRFRSAPLTQSVTAARQHVEGRAEDLAQVRTETGHAGNAVGIVGRRETTRGLFLDRRAFLTSYDPKQDDAEQSILTRILRSVFPVCAGINLEYYFSYVDNTGFGSGTKLPHNISALLGVMDGAASDLRTGLPWQMVEIHEPVRLLNVIETTPEAMLRILDRDPGIGRLCKNGWVRLAVLHPETYEVSFFEDGEFSPYRPKSKTLPRASSSADWYRGWRDHLEFAEILP
jgi:uncharacterized protein YbcC (UPF0753/DUF2309 family)